MRQATVRLWSTLMGTGALVALGLLFGPGIPAQAQQGLILTGSEGVPVLGYKLDFEGVVNRFDRYRMDLPAQNVAVAEIQISGDRNFNGEIDPKNVRLEAEGKPVELSEVYWNNEFRSLEVVAKEPVAAGQRMQLILSQVRNPSDVGIFRFVGRVRGTEANPLFRTIGNWLISIGNGR